MDPRATVYGVVAPRSFGLAVDLLPDRALGDLIDAHGAVRGSVACRLPRAAADRSPVGDVGAVLRAACAAAEVPASRVGSIVVGLQGAVDPGTDRLSFTATIPGWPRRGPRAALADGLGVDVRIENDVNLAAVAERATGAGRDADGFVLLWIGDGLGLAVDIDGTLHRGASGGAGEIGYLPVSGAGLAIEPTAKDLTDLIGGPAVSKVLRRCGYRGRNLADLLAGLVEAPTAAVLDLLAARIAIGLVAVLAVLDPALVILGGPIAAAGGADLARRVHAEIRRSSRWSTPVQTAGVPDRPVLAGARTLVHSSIRLQLSDQL